LASLAKGHIGATKVAEVATLLSCSAGIVYLTARQQRIPAIKFGSMLRFDLGTIAEWIRSKTTVIA
jgi:excisionase family DNA binding protein